jgi:hypothetical protein
MIKARKLLPGDTVAAVSLSWGGPGAFPRRYEAGKRQLEEEFGLEVVETRHALRDPGWLHRNPQARASSRLPDPTTPLSLLLRKAPIGPITTHVEPSFGIGRPFP